jgi:hypothetical protein
MSRRQRLIRFGGGSFVEIARQRLAGGRIDRVKNFAEPGLAAGDQILAVEVHAGIMEEDATLCHPDGTTA